MPITRTYAQVDVFSSVPYLGNPVAVILDADDLSDEQMLQVARWTNLSETTFVSAPTTPAADYRVRIFTPGGELPFAGHPTLGTAHAWLENGGSQLRPGHVVQECEAGLVSIRRDGDTLFFEAPPTRRTGPLEEDFLHQVCASFGLDPAQVIAHHWVDNGPGWAVLRLATAHEVLALQPDLSTLPGGMVGVIGAHPEGSEHAFELRAFAPAIGVPEDPVCGSINASIGQWLLGSGQFPEGYRVSQGQVLGRAGRITVLPGADGQIWVGGSTVTLFRGTALV